MKFRYSFDRRYLSGPNAGKRETITKEVESFAAASGQTIVLRNVMDSNVTVRSATVGDAGTTVTDPVTYLIVYVSKIRTVYEVTDQPGEVAASETDGL